LCFVIIHYIKRIEKEPNLLKIEGDVSIVGDIHGQFYDLIHLYEKIKKPPKMQLLFLGDYVDRGIYSIEVLAFLFALKVFMT
jgi:serine/threonine-protein phosphatase 2B catalytic subunit